jgi:hypothetical protein
MRASAMRSEVTELSTCTSSTRTTPWTRTNSSPWLSCSARSPEISRLPFGSTSVMTAVMLPVRAFCCVAVPLPVKARLAASVVSPFSGTLPANTGACSVVSLSFWVFMLAVLEALNASVRRIVMTSPTR